MLAKPLTAALNGSFIVPNTGMSIRMTCLYHNPSSVYTGQFNP